MHSKVFSAALTGINALLVEVEANTMTGVPSLNIVGLPDKTVNESKERITAAIKNSGFKPPHHFNLKITINLAPADLKKEGPAFDLPIALAVLAATKQIKSIYLNNLFVGELSLDGELRPIKGAISFAFLAKSLAKKIFIPASNTEETSILENTETVPANNLKELIKFLTQEIPVCPKPHVGQDCPTWGFGQTEKEFLIDSIRGQESAKRALLVAAAGKHNLLLVGPPGAGKSLLAKSLMELLPPLTQTEMIEVAKIFSATGLTRKRGVFNQAPFRSPHHTASAAAILGGGVKLRPGEITLAHYGILFLDELPEFQRQILEGLREPMEEGSITIARAKETLTYPAQFMLIAAMNPCPCGYLTDQIRDCKCGAGQINMYKRKISGPFLDRFDMILEIPRLDLKKIINSESMPSLSGKIALDTIIKARQAQQKRFDKLTFSTNSQIPASRIDKLINLQPKDKEFLSGAADKLGLSMRAFHRILRVAQTIADLTQAEEIKKEHLLEALQYRQRQEI